ncbi:hypothetical protein KJB62_12670 [Staphylococcus saprophyticus]|uniref:hypothetical protein n=1 Tax=Staphylococcus saprophyticus TaxID=29385 RepID=UPI001F21A03F|nr:hypothetical protein [Staphylococcus saprophyticus]MCE5132221.1 hypothetical protein [Staphylococcus saprophyticus]
MPEQEMSLFEIIATFYQGEYWHELQEIQDILLQEIKEDRVSLAESDFGSITEFAGTTVYIPSENAVVKDIYSFEYEQEFEEKLYFKDNEEFKEYLWSVSFDGLLEPNIGEEKLVEIVKC